MSWPGRSIWLVATLTAVLVAALVASVWQSRRYEDPFDTDGPALLETLRREEAERQSAVLRARIGLESNYDDLTTEQHHVDDALEAFEARASSRPRGESPELSGLRSALRTKIAFEADLIERFKSSNSLLANSLSFLPTAAAEISVDGTEGVDPATARARRTIDRLLLASVLRSQHAAHVDAGEIAGQLVQLERDRGAMPESRRPALDLFRAHVQTVNREQLTVDATLREIDAMSMQTVIGRVHDRLSQEARDDAAHGQIYHRFLLAFSSVLVVLFLAVAIRLARSMGELRRVAHQLQEVNDGLEGRVAQRTRDLLAANEMLDRTGRIGGVGGWQVDMATMDVQWTAETRRIHDLEPEYRPTLEEAVSYYAPEARPLIDAAVASALAGGPGWDLELPFVTAKGRSIWVRAIGVPQIEDGKVVRLSGAFQDITSRRTLEAELRRNNAVLATVMENLPCGLSVFDGDLTLIASNRQYRTLLDFPDSLFDDRVTTLEDILRFNQTRGDYDGVDAEAAIHAFLQHARNPPKNYYLQRTRPNGHPLEVRGGPLPGGGFVLTHTDVSERIDAETKRLQSERLLRSAIDAVDEGFVLFDGDDRLVYCNETYRGTFQGHADRIVPGVTFEQIQHLILEADIFDADVTDRATWVADRMDQHRTGDTMIARRLRDGRVLRAIDRRTPDGHTVGFRADITELVRATDTAQAASLAKSQFMANMSHEIRTPMNAILGMLTLLRRTELNERQADYAAQTDSAARSLLVLLNDVLDFSKVEAGKMEIERQPFDTAALVKDLAVIASASIGTKPIRLLFDLDPHLPRRLVGDALRLQQVLVNLLGNAIKFTESGEVVLQVALVERTARSAVVGFIVSDSGIGIAAEMHERIFGGFTQAEASTTRRFGGTGLGLTISHRLVALMGGQLGLESAPGEGSRFHFRVELDLGHDSDAGRDEPVDRAPARVRLVDDHPGARDAVARAARTLGWDVDAAASADARVDAIVVSAARALDEPAGSGEARQDAPLRFVVGSHSDRDRLARAGRTEDAGFDAYLVEPVTPAMLRAAMERRDDIVTRPMPLPLAPSTSAAGRPTPTSARPLRLASLRVLLVEDNVHNQQVARELLEDEGATVRVAGDGQQALDVLVAARDAHDIVLMDIQMPVMDGFTASRRIRAELGAVLPIVAMTANATASDRAACAAAGMNDHVGKPFDLDALVDCVLRQTGRATSTVTHGARALPGLPSDVGEAAATGGIDIEAALLRLGGNRAAYRRLLASVLAQLAHAADDWHAGADRDTTLRRLHTLKGLAATLGATALSASAAAAENRLRADGERGDVAAAVSRVLLAIDAARPGLAALLQAWPEPERIDIVATRAPLDDATLRAGLEGIARHLRHADMAALEAMDALHDGASGPSPALDALRAAIAGLDFERALALCDELRDDLHPEAATPA